MSEKYGEDQPWHLTQEPDAEPSYEELTDRIEELQAERDEAWRRAAYAEEQWGHCEVKLAKAMELANLVVEFSDRALWKVVKEVVLELKGEK